MIPFIIFTTQRSGSTVLTRTLDEHPEIFCAGELFHENNDIHHPEWHFPSWALSEKNRTLRKIDRIINYPNLRLRAIPHIKKFYKNTNKHEKARGFKLMITQMRAMPFLWNYLKQNNVKVIVLIRKNIFKTALSRLRKDETGVPHVTKAPPGNTKLRISPEKLLKRLHSLEKANRQLLNFSEGMDRIVLYYEDFNQWNDMLNKVFNFLQVSNVTLQPVLSKLSTKDWREEVKNYSEIEKLMKQNNYTQYL
ncbi:MAG TPA: sulfotransferase [Chitinophagaceae bacterium]|nr:sulfotransferase [Chitinophagaceae bacterium]